MAKTSDRLLAGIKRRVVIPSSQALLSDTDILAIADDVIEAEIVPLIKSVRQDYFVTTATQALTSGTDTYAIPTRAVGRAIRDLKLVDANGSTRDLALIALEDEHLFAQATSPQGFYFNEDKVVLVNAPSTSGLSIKYWYERRPNSLVKIDQAAKVVSSTTTSVTVTSIPSVITAAVSVDFIHGISGATTISMDKTVQSAAGTTLNFTSGDIPTDLAANDYVSVAGTSPLLQLPDEAYRHLETLCAKEILDLIGDFEGSARLGEAATKEEKNLKQILEPRVQGEATVVINRKSLLRGRRTLIRRGFSV